MQDWIIREGGKAAHWREGQGSIFRMGAVEHTEATKGFSLRKTRTFLKWKNSSGTSSRQVCISFLILRELSHSRFANDDIYK